MNKKIITTAIAAVLISVSSIAPAFAQSGRQKDKNNMRTLGIGLGAAAAYKVLKGDWKTGAVLGAGAAYAGKKYEDARKAQGKENRTVRVYRYRDGRRIGYYLYRNGRRVSDYQRLRANG